MPELGGLHFAHFNNLYVIAVGLTMAYIVVANKKNNASFFSILSSITSYVKEKVLIIPNKKKEQEEDAITQIEYYINSNLLQATTKGSLSNINKRAKKELNKFMVYENFVEDKLQSHTKTGFLNVISCDCFLYGLFILFAGAFEKECNTYINGLIVILLGAILLLLIHCLCFEHFKLESRIRYCKPRILNHVAILIIAFYFGYKFNNAAIFSNVSCGQLSVLSVLACYIGFIGYLLSVVASNFILLFKILAKAFKLRFFSAVEDHKQEIENHRDELDEIDKFLSELKMEESLSINNR